MYKLFHFAPIAILQPKNAAGVALAENPFQTLFVELFGNEDGTTIYNAAVDRAKGFSLTFTQGRALPYYTFADGLSFPFAAKTDGASLNYGNGLPLEKPVFVLEWQRLLRCARAVLVRFASSYVQAKNAFNSLQYESAGKTQYSNSAESSNTTTDKYRGGVRGLSADPTGEVNVEGNSDSHGTTDAMAGFSGIWAGVGLFVDGAIKSPKTAVIDALFDALFVEYHQHGDKFIFGDVKIDAWGN